MTTRTDSDRTGCGIQDAGFGTRKAERGRRNAPRLRHLASCILHLAAIALLAPAAHAACTNSISPADRTHGPGAATNTISVTASNTCAWTVVHANPWISILSGDSGMGDGVVNYSVAANPNVAWRTGLVTVAGQTLTLRQRGVACPSVLSPGSRTHGHGTANGLISVTGTVDCAWAVVSTSAWVNITAGSGSGNGSIIYSVQANPSGLGRATTLVVGDQSFLLSQLGAPCAYSIAPTSRAHGFSAETGLVSVTATPDCHWTATTSNGWIAFTTAAEGTGSGSIGYALELNAGLARTGHVAVADKVFAVVQQGMGCTFKLSPTNRTHGHAGATNSVTLTTSNGCPWQILNTNAWIHFTNGNSGSGSNVIFYTVEANPNPGPRSGTVLIDGQTLTLTQNGVLCEYEVSPGLRNHGHGAASNFLHVSTGEGCAWNVVNTNGWLNLLAASGAGDADIGYLVAPNPNSFARTGSVVVAGQVFTVSQSPAPCEYSIAPASAAHGFNAETGLVSVTAVGGCAWTVENSNAWLTVLAVNSELGTRNAEPWLGAGNGSVAYSVAANEGGPRAGNVVIAGNVFAVSQAANTCTYRISPANRPHGHGAASNFFTVTAGSNCAWTVVNPNAWITLVSAGPAGGVQGMGSNTVGYTVAPNPAGLGRTGMISVADQVMTISQNAVPCTYSLTPPAGAHGPNAGTGVVNVVTLAGCSWGVTNTNAWVVILAGSNGIGGGPVTYAFEANPETNARSGTLRIDGLDFSITQAGVPAECSYRLSPTNRAHGFAATTNSVDVLAAEGCAWTAESSAGWITILGGASGNGNGTLDYAIEANSTGVERIGVVMVSGQSFIITQKIVSCSFSLSPAGRSHGHGETTNSFSVSVGSACSWSVVNSNSWVTILSGGSGAGNGTVTYAVAANSSLSPRAGNLVVDGQVYAVMQDGFVCSFRLSPTNRTHGFAATTNTVNVITTTNCAWTATASDPWITILSGGGGAGNGTVTYSVLGNLTPIQRTGTVMVADQALTLVQRAATNGFSFEAITMQEGGSVRLRLVGAPAGVWAVQSSSNLLDWVHLTHVTNVTGAVEHIDPGQPHRGLRFYRAVLP